MYKTMEFSQKSQVLTVTFFYDKNNKFKTPGSANLHSPNCNKVRVLSSISSLQLACHRHRAA